MLSMIGAVDLDDYTARADQWVRSVWSSWAEHHALIRAQVEQLVRG